MNKADLLNFCKLSIEETEIDCTEITEDTNFKSDLGFDSLQLTEFVMRVENEYGIEIPTSYLANVETVGDLIVSVMKMEGYDSL